MHNIKKSNELEAIYDLLLTELGPQRWWPAETEFEVIVGAILTQSTSWKNVEKAIKNLKDEGLLKPAKLEKVGEDRLSQLIKPSLYHNMKARKIKAFLGFFRRGYGMDISRMKAEDIRTLRPRLLGVWGIGPETADSILLYALGKPSFVVDAYTVRIFRRIGLLGEGLDYDGLRSFMEDNLEADAGIYNEYHALIVALGKDYCRKKPRCGECPLSRLCRKKIF
ncbi:endonuclease III domain-containing protein [Candidatus Altiarchaeota archaeon]